MEQNPFSIYDFLGYLVPGAVFFSSLLYILHKHHIFSVIPLPEGESIFWLIILAFVVFSYTFGFALSVISAEIVEKYLIWRVGYPSKIRFGLGRQGFWSSVFKDGLLNGFTFLLLVFISILPVIPLDIFFGKILSLEKKYFKEYRDSREKKYVENNVKKILVHIDNCADCFMKKEVNFFKYLYHYAYENNSKHSHKMQNYVALYGFSRTLCLIMSLMFTGNIIMVILHCLGCLEISINDLSKVKIMLFGTGCLSYVFFLGFAKFYRRYTDEVLMAICAMMNPCKIK